MLTQKIMGGGLTIKTNQPYSTVFAHTPKSFPNFFERGHSSGFPGISYQLTTQIGPIGAIFGIFNPFKSKLLTIRTYAYGVCPCQKSYPNFLEEVTQAVSGNKPHILTQIGPKMCNFLICTFLALFGSKYAAYYSRTTA